MTYLLMSETGLNKASWTKSIVTPCLNALTISADPIPEQIAVIRVGSVGVSVVGIEKPWTVVRGWGAILETAGKIRIASLDSKIQLIELGTCARYNPDQVAALRQ